MCNPDIIHNLLSDLTINIGEQCEVQSIDLEEAIRTYAEEYCSNIDDDTLSLVQYSSKAAYFMVLKTFEKALRSTLIRNNED